MLDLLPPEDLVPWRISGAWFDLVVDATLAEIRDTPPPREPSPAETAAELADLRAARGSASVRALLSAPVRESQSSWQLQRCASERQLYVAVSTWQGARRATADRLLASIDADLTGDLGERGPR